MPWRCNPLLAVSDQLRSGEGGQRWLGAASVSSHLRCKGCWCTRLHGRREKNTSIIVTQRTLAHKIFTAPAAAVHSLDSWASPAHRKLPNHFLISFFRSQRKMFVPRCRWLLPYFHTLIWSSQTSCLTPVILSGQMAHTHTHTYSPLP